MRTASRSFAALLLAGAVFSAVAGDPVAPAAPAAGSEATAAAPSVQTVEVEKVCRMERTIGSNRSKRVCRTKAEMEREKAHAQQQLSNPSNGG